jgi:predicted TPR repeat methyltransferase
MLMQLPWLMGGSEKRGEEALRRSAELAPEWAKPPLRLGQYYWKNGEGERARIEAQHARDLAAASGEKKYLEEAEKLLSDIAASR